MFISLYNNIILFLSKLYFVIFFNKTALRNPSHIFSNYIILFRSENILVLRTFRTKGKILNSMHKRNIATSAMRYLARSEMHQSISVGRCCQSVPTPDLAQHSLKCTADRDLVCSASHFIPTGLRLLRTVRKRIAGLVHGVPL